ncbi:MAG: hypothetical protein ACLPM8_19180 [Myxococcaceae bacterium]
MDFRLDEGLVLVRCIGCGQEQRLSVSAAGGEPAPVVPRPVAARPRGAAGPAPVRLLGAPGPASIEAAFEPPQGFCPKCVAPRGPSATSCPACGLVFSNAVLDSTLQPSSGLAAAWRELAARWGEAPEHQRFLQLAASGGELTAAGYLYRIRLAKAPTDALARSSLEAAVKLASAPVSVAALKAAPSAETSSRRRAKAVAMAAVLLLAPTVALAVLRLLGRH